jgi:hypothetical protein
MDDVVGKILQHKVMSEATSTLEDELLQWATRAGVPTKAAEWREELVGQGIGNLQTLGEWADNDDAFITLCATVSKGMRVKAETLVQADIPRQ